MKKPLILIVVIMMLSLVGGSWMPWWIIALIALVAAFLAGMGHFTSFLVCFIAGFISWGGLAWYFDMQNASLLSTKIGALFNGLNPIILIAITGLIGGLLSGVGGWTGASLRSFLNR